MEDYTFSVYNPHKVYDFFELHNLELSKIIQDQSDGLLIYDGYMRLENIGFQEIPEVFLHFKKFNSLTLNNFKNLKNLRNLRNLTCVESSLNITYCPSLENLKGLENLQYVGWILNIDKHIKFDGLNPKLKTNNNNTKYFVGDLKVFEYLEYRKKEAFKELEEMSK